MALPDLLKPEYNVYLVLSNSSKARLHVYDTLKERAKAGLNSIIKVDSKQSWNDMVSMIGTESLLADKWLVEIEYNKLRGIVGRNKGVFMTESAVFLINVYRYSDFLRFKEEVSQCVGLYLSAIRYRDVQYLLDGYNLSQKVLDFVAKSYFRDVEKVFELRDALKSGIEVKTEKDVISLLGEGSGTVFELVVSLTRPIKVSKNGKSIAMKNRISDMDQLTKSFGYRSLYTMIGSTIYDVLCLKVLYLNGKIYDIVENTPNGYDEQRLSKYNSMLRTITENIDYNNLVRLFVAFAEYGKWESQSDTIGFLYNYYETQFQGVS